MGKTAFSMIGSCLPFFFLSSFILISPSLPQRTTWQLHLTSRFFFFGLYSIVYIISLFLNARLQGIGRIT